MYVSPFRKWPRCISSRDGVTVTRNARIIYVYYANNGVMAYRISDKDLSLFFMLVYIKYIYEISFLKFRKRCSLSLLCAKRRLIGNVFPKNSLSQGKRKKKWQIRSSIYRESAYFRACKIASRARTSPVIRSGVSARVRQDRRVKHNWY